MVSHAFIKHLDLISTTLSCIKSTVDCYFYVHQFGSRKALKRKRILPNTINHITCAARFKEKILRPLSVHILLVLSSVVFSAQSNTEFSLFLPNISYFTNEIQFPHRDMKSKKELIIREKTRLSEDHCTLKASFRFAFGLFIL